jgi:hypothetical protein
LVGRLSALSDISGQPQDQAIDTNPELRRTTEGRYFMTDANALTANEPSGDLERTMIEIRFDGKHSTVDESSSTLVMDTRANIEALLDRIRARGIWADSWIADPEPVTAVALWDELFGDEIAFEDAPRERIDQRPTRLKSWTSPIQPPTADSVRQTYLLNVLTPDEPVVSALVDTLIQEIAPDATWSDLDNRVQELREERGLAGENDRAPGAWGASQLQSGLRDLAIREAARD